ncbi:MAG: flippase [Lentisphaeria bacterium]|nr:flippase [Lentisphaeria bacterium]
MLEKLRQLLRRIADHRGVRRYGANTLWMLAEKGCRLILGFLVGIYVARQLGPAQFGLLNYAISFIALFSMLATIGMDPVIVRELVRRPGKSASILGSALGLKAAGFAVMAAVVGAVLFFSPMSNSDRVLMAIILAGYGFQVFQIFDFNFQARVLGKYSAMSQIAALLITSGFRLWFAWKGAPLWCFAAVESGYMALSALGYALFYRKLDGRFHHWRFDCGEAGFLLRESLPLFLAGTASMFYLRFDQVIVTWMLGDAANGQYAAAVRLLEALYLLPLVVSDSFFPSLVGTRSTSLLRYYRRTEQLMRFMFYCALAILLPAAVAGYFMIVLLFGAAYREAAWLFVLLLLKIPVVYPGLVYGKWYLAEGMQKISMVVAFCGCGMSVLLDYLMISWWGLTGVAAAAVVTNFSIYLVFPLFFRKGRVGVRLFLRSLLPVLPRLANDGRKK